MSKKQKRKNNAKKSKKSSSSSSPLLGSGLARTTEISGDGWAFVDPARIRFQHSKIRPYFSGCGRSVKSTLEDIRARRLSAEDLPPIQVLIGPDENDGNGPWYFSLNNRRLWVLKRCREEGLLPNNENLVRVRVRAPKSASEVSRYTLENCAGEAKFLREAPPRSKKYDDGNTEVREDNTTTNLAAAAAVGEDSCISLDVKEEKLNVNMTDEQASRNMSEEEVSSSDDDGSNGYVNPFSVLL